MIAYAPVNRAIARTLLLLAALLAVIVTLMPSTASAQAITSSNTTAGAIPESVTCATRVTRSFTITNTQIIGDVNVGAIITHATRSNLRLSIAHTNPTNTVTVNLMTNVTDASDNLNVLFDDSAAAAITTHTGANDNATTAPWQRTFRPQSVLSAFNGRAMNGTWTFTVCDSVVGTTGTFNRVDLILTPSVNMGITKTDGVSSMASLAATNYTITVTNNGPNAITGAILTDPAATGLTKNQVLCSPTPGQCTAGTTPTIAQLEAGYALPALASGQTYQFRVIATATATSGTVTNVATVATPTTYIDLVPGNNSASDANSVTTRVAGTPPNVTCPAGSVQRVFDWTASNWTNGVASQTVAIPFVGDTQIGFALSGGLFETDPNTGELSPNSTNFASYGLGTNPWVIRTAINLTNNSQVMTASYVLPTAVPAAQFQLFDVDYGPNAWADQVTVTASFNGSPVPVTLTPGLSNYVIGNSIYGDGASASAESRGNVFVTITQPVDTITLVYGNHTNLGTIVDPVSQFIAWGGFSKICDPLATISVTKISTVLTNPNDIKTNLYRIPGATVLYCITATNSGSGTTANVTMTDAIPSNVTFIPGTMKTGATCGTATTAEDDDDAGSDETDPAGMSITGTTVSGQVTSIAPGASRAFTFEATIN